jgi:hypothetical protein
VPREALPNRPAADVATFSYQGRRWATTFGRFPDGRIGEIFIDAPKDSDLARAGIGRGAVSVNWHGAEISREPRGARVEHDVSTIAPSFAALRISRRAAVFAHARERLSQFKALSVVFLEPVPVDHTPNKIGSAPRLKSQCVEGRCAVASIGFAMAHDVEARGAVRDQRVERRRASRKRAPAHTDDPLGALKEAARKALRSRGATLAFLDGRDAPSIVQAESSHQLRQRPPELTARARRMIRLLVEGDEDDLNHEPLDFYAAAAAVGYHRRSARQFSVSPHFVAAYQSARVGKNLAPQGPTIEDVARELRRRELDRALRERHRALICKLARAPEQAT